MIEAPGRAREGQTAFDRTGGLHATALFGGDGELLALREDVGRHNAMDKAIGAMLLAGRHPLPGALACLSGRVSFELVQKAVLAQLAGVIAVGAPTSLAVQLAEERGLLLCGFVRERRLQRLRGRRPPALWIASRPVWSSSPSWCRSSCSEWRWSSSPSRAGRALRARPTSPRGGRAFKIAIPVIYIVAGVVVPALVLANKGETTGGTGSLQSQELTEAQEHGKALFRQQCASCHTLAAVNARGVTGPNLDDIGEVTPDRIKNAIKNGGTGQDRMPSGLLEGEEAAAVAAYVSEVAGK